MECLLDLDVEIHILFIMLRFIYKVYMILLGSQTFHFQQNISKT